MARDRLAALRANRQQSGIPERHEMADLQTNDHVANGYGSGENDLPAFYAEATSVQDMIKQFDANVTRISELHSRSLNATDESAIQQNNAQLDELVEETRSLSNNLRGRIKMLGASRGPPEDAQQRKNRTTFLQRKFIESLQGYQQVEAQYRDRYKQRVERQFKIVKPDATPEEVSAVVNDDEGGGNQIFAQALSSTTQYGASRAVYREVQERHQDIRKIEQTFVELTQLINDMSVLLEQQEETIADVEESARKVEGDTEAGLRHTDKAVGWARSARKKRWICFILVIVILVIVAIILAVEIPKNK